MSALDPDRAPPPENPDEEHVYRFVESLILGEAADLLFKRECRKRGLRWPDCLDAPLVYLSQPMGNRSHARH